MNTNKISETCIMCSQSIRMQLRNGTRMTRMHATRINTDLISENLRSEIGGIRVLINNGTLTTRMQAGITDVNKNKVPHKA
jgi:queuine/archaeosine tRNA-ribosyltransferase